MRASLALVLVAAALACAAAPSARADGDPASDYLITQKIFFPFDLKVPAAQQRQFIALVDEANSKGFTLRVAVIGSGYDMGSITSLWQKPRTYARFLGAELQYAYKNRLLVVMPNGLGFNHPGRPTTRENAILAKIPVKPGAAGLVDSATTAVRALAKASGVKLTGTAAVAPSSRNHDRLIIVIAALVALAVAVSLRLALRGRGERP
jgi:hypothetical protein